MESTVQPTVQLEPRRMTGRKKGALWLLIAPTVLIIATFLLYSIVNFILNPTMQLPADGEPLAPTPVGITIANVILFLLGALGVFAWLPGIIVGIVLLVTAKK
jgi:ABC-type Na+ efflux pump permease subunit